MQIIKAAKYFLSAEDMSVLFVVFVTRQLQSDGMTYCASGRVGGCLDGEFRLA